MTPSASSTALLARARALLDALDTVPSASERDRARAMVAAAEARLGDIDGAVARAGAVATARPRRAAMVEIAQAVASTEPGRAEQIATSLSTEPFRSRALAAAGLSWAAAGRLDDAQRVVEAMGHRSVARDARRSLALLLAMTAPDTAERHVDAIAPGRAALAVRVELRCAQGRFGELEAIVASASTEAMRQDLCAEAAVALAERGRLDDAWAMLDRLYDPFGGPHHRAVAAADARARGADAVLRRVEGWAPDARLAGVLGAIDGLIARNELVRAEALVMSVAHALVPCALLARIAMAAVRTGDEPLALRVVEGVEDVYERAEVVAERVIARAQVGGFDDALTLAESIDAELAEGARARAARVLLGLAARAGDDVAVDRAVTLVRGPVARVAALCAAIEQAPPGD